MGRIFLKLEIKPSKNVGKYKKLKENSFTVHHILSKEVLILLNLFKQHFTLIKVVLYYE